VSLVSAAHEQRGLRAIHTTLTGRHVGGLCVGRSVLVCGLCVVASGCWSFNIIADSGPLQPLYTPPSLFADIT
jgi:hypothetical protein